METPSLQFGRNPKSQQHREPLHSGVLKMMGLNFGHGASPELGGDSSAVQGQLRDVQQVQATLVSFAAIQEIDLSLHGATQSMVVTVL